jgi:hypothetical protein
MESKTESNILIAVFMGGILETKVSEFTKKPIQSIYYGAGVQRDDCFDHSDQCAIRDRVEDLMYHKYWGWLMPVVEKIGLDHAVSVVTNNWNNYGAYQCYIYYCFDMKINNTRQLIAETMGANLIDVVYESCVKFIQWHNQQNPTTNE